MFIAQAAFLVDQCGNTLGACAAGAAAGMRPSAPQLHFQRVNASEAIVYSAGLSPHFGQAAPAGLVVATTPPPS